MRVLREALERLSPSQYKQLELELTPADGLKSKTKNLMAATNLGRRQLQQVQDFIAKHGVARTLGTGALAGGTATGLVIGGYRLLSPEEEAQLAITPDGELVAVEPEEESPVIPASAAALGAAALLADQYSRDRDEYETSLARTGDEYIQQLRQAADDSTAFTDAVLSKEAQKDLQDQISRQRRTRTRSSARK